MKRNSNGRLAVRRRGPARGAGLSRAARARLRGYLLVARFLHLRQGCASG